ncbi:MAG: lysylphosphatidylglycerol synthase transmembrane domain-containing protein [Syntrophobacterales bacterium]
MFLLLKSQDYPFSLNLVFKINLIGFFFNNFLPATIGGDAMRAYYFAKGRRIAPILATIVYDRLLGLTGLLLLLFTGLSLAWVFDLGFVWTKEFYWVFWGIVIALVTLGFIYGLSCWPRFLDLVERYIVKLPLGEAISRFISSVAGLSKYGLLILALVGISLGPHISYALAIYFVGQAFGLGANFWITLILSPLTFLSGILPLSPNNIGWTEYLGSLIWASQGISQGGDLWMAYRLMYVLVSLSGLLFYLRLRAGALPHEN